MRHTARPTILCVKLINKGKNKVMIGYQHDCPLFRYIGSYNSSFNISTWFLLLLLPDNVGRLRFWGAGALEFTLQANHGLLVITSTWLLLAPLAHYYGQEASQVKQQVQRTSCTLPGLPLDCICRGIEPAPPCQARSPSPQRRP